MTVSAYLNDAIDVLRATVASQALEDATEAAITALIAAVRAGKPILVCGNGGSASDAMHIAGELVGRFLKERKAIKCVCLSADNAVITAIGNDY
ncbi:MAG: SIS domain-containing protein, partial [Pseudomonadota bacterium]|nr:SIS domain-containing protein [Pseudomonadota bacterium]